MIQNIPRMLLFVCIFISWMPSDAFVPTSSMPALLRHSLGNQRTCLIPTQCSGDSSFLKRNLEFRSWTRKLRCSASSEEQTGLISDKQAEFDNFVREGTAKKCVNILRSTEDVQVNEEQAWKLLSSIPMDFASEQERDQQLLTSYAYSALRKRSVLKNFGSIEATPSCLPYQSRDIDVSTLERVIGMDLASLTPRGTELSWQVAGLALCAAEYFIASKLGIDPLRTVIPLTASIFILDRTLLSGAMFESAYRFIFPEYKNKVIRHEAGHLLLAYLMGCPIQAGCVFFDNDLSAGIAANKLTRTTIDRYSIVVMGGIAAEACHYGRAEGGASDERLLVSFLVDLTPPWDQQRVLNQARWAVTQGILLLKEYHAAYDSLVQAMAANKPLGECIEAIETALRDNPRQVTLRAASPPAAMEEVPAAGGVIAPSPSTEAVRQELESVIEAKRKLLRDLELQEETLQAKIRDLEAQESYVRGELQWTDKEAKRLTEALLRSARRRRAETPAAAPGGGSDGSGKSAEAVLDAQLANARLERRLAQVELELLEKEAQIAALDRDMATLLRRR